MPRPAYSSNQVSETIKIEDANTDKLKNFMTNTNIKRFDKYRNKVHQNKTQTLQVQVPNQTQSSNGTNTEDEEPFNLYFDSQTNVELKQSSMFQSIELQNVSSIIDDLPRMATVKRFESLDDRDSDYLLPKNIQTISDSNNQKIEVSISIPASRSKNRFQRKSNSVINAQQLCQVGGGPTTIFHTKKNSHNLFKPIKQSNEKEQQSSRREYQPFADNKSFSENSSSTIGKRTGTRPQPFNLSRSNSRRAKHILQREQVEKEQKEQEEFESMKTLQQMRVKQIPVSNYVPKLLVLKSTKTLTEFQEFSFNSSRFSKTKRETLTFNDQCDIQEEQESQAEQSNSSFLKNLLKENDLNEDIIV